MFQQIFLVFLGLCSGVIIAGGLTGLLIGLSIVPRYAGITHTARYMLLYEDITLAGTVLGNLLYLFKWKISLGMPFPEFFWAAGSWLSLKWQMYFPFSPDGSAFSADFLLSSYA